MSQRALPTGDRISTFPDAVLCHILSFLPTKLAASTTVLSKRWNRLWLSVPTLDFDDARYLQTKDAYYRCFTRSVYAAILSRHLHQPIKTFRLTCRSSSHFRDPSDVNIWVDAALQRRVEHLDLSMVSHSHLNLPFGILSCRTLAVLKLKYFAVKAFLYIDLPVLKILHLECVSFLESRYLAELVCRCPCLEDLQAKSLEFIDTDSLTEADFKSLPKLVRAYVSHSWFPFTAMDNVEFLHMDEMGSDWDQFTNHYGKYSIPVFNNLTHLELNYIDYPNWPEVVEILKHCPKLQVLVIGKENFEFFLEDETFGDHWPYPGSVPKSILSHLRTCCLTKYKGSKGELRFVRYILQNARVLKTMTIYSTAGSSQPDKLEMIKELSLCTRCSATCKLSFI